MTTLQERVDEALSLLFRHVRGAPTVHFGDSRGRSSSIRESVHRLPADELERQFRIIEAMARHVPHTMIPRDRRRDLYDVGHEIRMEYWDRCRKG
jgi:hypothetical protein